MKIFCKKMSEEDQAVIAKLDDLYLGVDSDGSVGIYFELNKRCYCEEEYISYSGIRYFDHGLPSKSMDKLAEYIIEGDGYSTLCVDDEVAPSFDRNISELDGDVSILSNKNLKVYEYLDANLSKIEGALNKYAQNLHNYAVFDEDGQHIGWYDDLKEQKDNINDDDEFGDDYYKELERKKKDSEKTLELFRYVGDVFSGTIYHLFGIHIENVKSEVFPTKGVLKYCEPGMNSDIASFFKDIANPDKILNLKWYEMPSYHSVVPAEEYNWDKLESAKYVLHKFYDSTKYIYESLDDVTKRKLDKLKNVSDSFVRRMYEIGKSLPTSIANSSDIIIHGAWQ